MASLLEHLTGQRSHTEDLSETVLTEAKSVRIDEEAGVIYDVKIIGCESQNGHEYTDKALADAVPLYEGAEIFSPHPAPGKEATERPVFESMGNLRNVRHAPRENRGDFHYLKSDPHTPKLLERIRRGFPIGLSHNAAGKIVTRGGKKFVEAIQKVRSVDLVLRPATTRSLTESVDESEMTTINEVIAATEDCPARAILEAFATDYPMMGKSPMAMPPGMQPDMMGQMQGPQANQALNAALKQALNALMDDNSLSLDEVIKIIRDKVGSVDPAEDGNEDEDMADDKDKKGDKDKPFKEELQKLTEQVAEDKKLLATLTKKGDIRDFMESNRVTPQSLGPERVKLLESCADEAGMKALLETWPPSVRNARPPIAQLTQLTESTKASAAPNSFQATRNLIRSR